VAGWLLGFVCTLAVETPVYVLGLGRALGLSRAALLALGLNLLTHPLAWRLTRSWSWSRFTAVEVGVAIVEAGALTILVRAQSRQRPMPTGRLWVLAFSANALSAGVGLLL
jgi:hypothetical protein